MVVVGRGEWGAARWRGEGGRKYPDMSVCPPTCPSVCSHSVAKVVTHYDNPNGQSVNLAEAPEKDENADDHENDNSNRGNEFSGGDGNNDDDENDNDDGGDTGDD